MEAPPGIGPGIRVLQTRALPLGHGAKSDILQYNTGENIFTPVKHKADYGDRTRHLDLGKVALYQMS